jgi:hypothetical protein
MIGEYCLYINKLITCTNTNSCASHSDEEDRKPAARPAVPLVIQIGDKRVQRGSDSAAAPAKKKKCGIDRVWDRTAARNEREKLMDIDKAEMTREQKRQRKAAKSTTKSMLKNEVNKSRIVQGILAMDGVNLSQATEYVEGNTINGNNFCSQKAVKRYRNGFESDSDSDE